MSPEQWIRKYLLDHGGRAVVPVHNLLTTWQLYELDDGVARMIEDALADAGITVDPPILAPYTGPDTLITLSAGDPAPTAEAVAPEPQPEPPAESTVQPDRIVLGRRPLSSPEPSPQEPYAPVAEPAPAPPDEALQALRRRPPRLPSRLPSGYGGPVEQPPAPAPTQPEPAPPGPPLVPLEKAGPLGGITVRMDLARMRKRHDEDLRNFGSLLFELYRVGSDRPELVADRMAELQATSDEILRAEQALGISSGGVCPRCRLYCSDARVCVACGHDLSPPPPGMTRRMSVPVVIVGVVMITGAWLFGGLGNGDRHQAQQQQRAAAPAPGPKFRSVSASAKGPSIGVYRSPRASRPSRTLSNPNIDGARLVFLIKRTRGNWAYVYLPSRPNGSMGWIKLSKVSLAGHNYRLTVDLGQRTIRAWKGSREIVSDRVGVGRAATPTPTGQYYITELLKQPDSTGTYGPYAFGLSVHSDVLFEFAGADGILGIHGTDEPDAIGTDVSHGCIRVYNRVIRKLARTLPVGTPVKIQRT